jgi:hypothetical protein
MSNITASTLTHSISDNDLDQVGQPNTADQDVNELIIIEFLSIK